MKKIFIFIFKTILGILSFLLAYLFIAIILTNITVDKENNTQEDIAIYILTNGVHCDLVVPIKSELYDWNKVVDFSNTQSKDSTYNYLAMGWGDKGFYLATPQWKDLKASVAFKAAFGLSTTAIHATFYKTMNEGERCKKIMISQSQYQRLIEYINNTFQKDVNGNVIYISTNANYGIHDAFYEANGSYSMLKTCNTWANSALKASGQKCCLWTPFDFGIFGKYE